MRTTRTTLSTRITLSATAALTLGAALALGAPLAASAHVSLQVNTAEAGSHALLTFQVPSESSTAATTSVTVTLPTDTPFVSVRTVPVPGWEAEVVTTTLPEPVQIGDTTVTEAPTSIMWTATGAGLGDSELGLFPFSAGPVPDVGHLELPVDQGYSDGSVESWSGDDVPILYVNDEPVAHHDEGSVDDDGGATDGDHGADDSSSSPDSTSITGVILGAGGLALGAIALAVALIRRQTVA